MKMAINDTKELQGVTGGAENVNKMRKSGDNKQCYRCGKSNHVSDDCYFKTTKCNNCGKIGHIYRKCKQEKVRKKRRNQNKKSKQEKKNAKVKQKQMRKKVNDELEDMVKRGILSPIEWSDWAAPIVPIPKSDGSVRICGDFKVTVNLNLNVDLYHLPTIDNMLATMAEVNSQKSISKPHIFKWKKEMIAKSFMHQYTKGAICFQLFGIRFFLGRSHF